MRIFRDFRKNNFDLIFLSNSKKINISRKTQCCGCEACIQVCPHDSISFEEDIEGFFYPKVDTSSCIECGLCRSVCPVLNQGKAKLPLSVYAAKNKNGQELLKSSSGGLFILLAKETISQGGVVFGARFNDNWEVIHDYAETEVGLQAFIGSKYV